MIPHVVKIGNCRDLLEAIVGKDKSGFLNGGKPQQLQAPRKAVAALLVRLRNIEKDEPPLSVPDGRHDGTKRANRRAADDVLARLREAYSAPAPPRRNLKIIFSPRLGKAPAKIPIGKH